MLTPGREVTVTVVDPAGHAVKASEVVAQVAGVPERLGRREPSGAFMFSDLPEARVNVRATVGGRVYPQSHDTRQSSARIVVPVHGSMAVRWEFGLEAEAINQLRIETAFPGGPALTEFVENTAEKTKGEMRLPAILPGEYVICLEAKQFNPMSDEGAFHDVSKRMSVTVTADAVAHVLLMQ